MLNKKTKSGRSSLTLLLVAVLALAWGPAGAAETVGAAAQATATVVEVIDGQTLRVNAPDCQDCRVRLAGIDAPAQDQPYAAQSRAMLNRLVGGVGATVELVADGMDQSGRLLAKVYRDQVNVNWAMIKQGGASMYDYYASSGALKRLQASAKRAGIGLWGMVKNPHAGSGDWPHDPNTRDFLGNVQDTADALDDLIKGSAAAIGDYWPKR